MLSSKNLKLLLISIVTIFLLVPFGAYKVFSCTIILEIEGENREKEICLHSDDIDNYCNDTFYGKSLALGRS